MEHYFFILCIVCFVLFVWLAQYIFSYIGREISLYRMYSKNGELRALMAKDARRFHISIVYLMTYMARSDGDDVQFDKLKMILRYIREVCPQEWQVDAVEALKYLTDREKGSGKSRRTMSVISVRGFKEGEGLLYTDESTKGWKYTHDLHGTKLAEELGLYLSESDRLYVMFLLSRLAASDNRITTKGKKSESYLLYKLCVKGLKIGKPEFQSLLDSFGAGKVNEWYNNHFAGKDNNFPSVEVSSSLVPKGTATSVGKETAYPPVGVLADIFRCESCSFAYSEKRVMVTSFLNKLTMGIGASTAACFILFWIYMKYEEDLMCNFVDGNTILVCVVVWVLSLILCFTIPTLDSSVLPVLRTKAENGIQLRGIIMSLVAAIPSMAILFLVLTNTLFMVANEVYSEKTIKVERTVEDVYTTTSSGKHKKTYYHIKFLGVSLLGEDLKVEKPKSLSAPNAMSLEALRYLSGRKFWGIENSKVLKSVEVSHSDYSGATGKDVELTFGVGYYGAAFYDTYRLKNN